MQTLNNYQNDFCLKCMTTWIKGLYFIDFFFQNFMLIYNRITSTSGMKAWRNNKWWLYDTQKDIAYNMILLDFPDPVLLSSHE